MISILKLRFGVGSALVLVLLSLLRTFGADALDWAKEREFWSFRQPKDHPLPRVANRAWPTQPLDYFVLAGIEHAHLKPAPQADRRTLLRRATFDLTGLPPSPEDAARFLNDDRPEAYELLVDRLLNSRAFGEHFASLWLPLARYAEDQAHQVGNDTKFFYPNAFLYRAWVIDAFNRDLPYDQFLKLQLAADKLNATNDLAALGFLGLGPKYYNRNRIEVMADEWEDRVDTVTRTMLGLTVACARCHDHKFDPITAADYYALAGVFASTKMVNRSSRGGEEPKDASADKMTADTLHIVEDGEAKDLNIFVRGSPERKGDLAQRRFLRILCEGEPAKFSDGSGRRELAEAIASVRNPLTARVFVNRLWGALFGQPLAATPSNFGHSGQAPTHPELLDDLSVRFMQNGWSIKSVVREIVLSSTYRQSSARAPSPADPANRLLAHMNRKRLTIEQWRDAVLFFSHELSPEGGKSLELSDPENSRRTVYGRVSRLKLNDTLMQFDYPDANVHSERRPVTTTPIQKLFVLNSPFILARSRALADRIEQSASPTEAVRSAYRLLFDREPTAKEFAAASNFLAQPMESEFSPLAQFAQILFSSNEFLYVD